LEELVKAEEYGDGSANDDEEEKGKWRGDRKDIAEDQDLCDLSLVHTLVRHQPRGKVVGWQQHLRGSQFKADIRLRCKC
jgi:hypothetical protein